MPLNFSTCNPNTLADKVGSHRRSRLSLVLVEFRSWDSKRNVRAWVIEWACLFQKTRWRQYQIFRSAIHDPILRRFFTSYHIFNHQASTSIGEGSSHLRGSFNLVCISHGEKVDFSHHSWFSEFSYSLV